jgi:mRNA interferase RelE/StbE
LTYRVELSKEADKQLESLSQDLQRQVKPKIDALAENPRSRSAGKLKGATDLYRIRVRDYRVVYRIQDQVLLVVVVKIQHRSKVYQDRRKKPHTSKAGAAFYRNPCF